MVVAIISKFLTYIPTLVAVVWEIVCYVWTYILWRTPTSYPGGRYSPTPYAVALFHCTHTIFVYNCFLSLCRTP